MENKEKKEALNRYLQETVSWEVDKINSLKRSHFAAWCLAIAGLSIGAICAWAVGQLSPLKTVVPYVIRVNETSGTVDIIKALEDGKTTYEESLNKYFLGWYLRYREGYSRTLAESYYYNVGLMSGGKEKNRYFTYFKPSNPNSPLNIYNENEQIKIKVKSISFIGEELALVRYIRTFERVGTDKLELTHWAATVKFTYSGAPQSEDDRSINPLGFQVIEYRTDPDSNVNSTRPSITYKAPKPQPNKQIIGSTLNPVASKEANQ